MAEIKTMEIEIEKPKTVKRKYGYEYKFETAEGFYYALLNFNDIMAKGLLPYKSESHQSTRWIFRGHWKSNWPLQPSAFRKDWYKIFRHRRVGFFIMLLNQVKDAIKNKSLKKGEYEIVPQIKTEYFLLRRFMDTANDLGINCNYIDSSYDDYSKNPEEWPDSRILPAMALAQHHRFPTRLLDFTYNPLLAAFFAAVYPFENKLNKIAKNKKLCVWVIEERNITLNSWQKVPVPINRSSNLFAQEGVLILDPDANQRFAETAKWHPLTTIKKNGSFIKLTLPQKECKKLLRRLSQDNITPARIKPNLDSVTQTLEYAEWLRDKEKLFQNFS